MTSYRGAKAEYLVTGLPPGVQTLGDLLAIQSVLVIYARH